MLEGRNLWELMVKRAEATPDRRMAVDEDDRTLTYAEFVTETEKAAAGLAELGLAEGDVVSWQLPTWFESMILVSALTRLGVVQNPIIPIYRSREVGFVTRQAGSKLLVVPSEWKGFDYGGMANEIAADNDALEVLICDKKLPQGDPASLPAPPESPATPDDAPVRWLFYTSGTTADPKGAKHTDPSIDAIGRGMCRRLQVEEDDVGAMVFPFTHIGGITWLFASLQTGALNIFIEAFDPATTIPLMQKHEITMAGAGTPFHLAYLAAQRQNPDTPLFPKVRVAPGGGAPKPQGLHDEVKKELGGVGICSGYGLTEAPILTMVDVDDPDEAKDLTEGRPMDGVDLRIVKDDGSIAGPGEEGEVRAKAPQLMKGYLDSSLDADAFDEDGYFRTGDLGSQDEDGNLVITGRLKDIIIRKGENVSAKQVEDLLYQHPQVADVAVIGLPDAKSGERVCAVVVPEGEPLELDEMREFLTGKGLRIQAVPEQLETVDALPRNPTGKVVKYELRDQFG